MLCVVTEAFYFSTFPIRLANKLKCILKILYCAFFSFVCTSLHMH